MIVSNEIRQALTALRYHHRLRLEQVPDYAGSSFETDTIQGIETLKELHNRMTDSDHFNFLGGEI